MPAEGWQLLLVRHARCGQRRFKPKTERVAIAFDVDTGKMHQHGSPKRIHSWATMTRRRLRAAGAQDMAHNIVASGRQRLEALNKCLGIQDYCRRMLQRLATLPHGKLQRTAEPFQRAA